MGMLYKLLQHNKVQAKQFAQEFEISVRTVYRYIDVLCGAGVPICSLKGKDGGYYIDSKLKIANIYLSKKEIEYLINNLQKLQNKTIDENIVLAKLSSYFSYINGISI